MFRIKDFIKNNRIKQSELASIFGVGQSTASYIVNGKMPVSEERVELLRNRFGSELVNSYIVPDEAKDFIVEKPDPNPTDAMSIISSLIASNKAKDEELSQLRKELAHLTRCFQVLAERYGVSATSIEKTAI